jgi:hypothetical protein
VIAVSQAVWEKLVRPTGEKLVARIAFLELTDRVLCALDSKDERHLLIPVLSDDAEYRDIQSRGVSVVTRMLTVQGDDPAKYIDMHCMDMAGHDIFNLMGGEIADALRSPESQPYDVVKRVLSKWRRFWGQLPQQVLSREEIVGLFAELWLLSVWLLPKFGPDSIMAWKGPWGSRHDFEWPEKSIEVKATTNTRGRIHKIHGLRQLENPEQGPLFLFSMCLREEGGSSNNLPSMIESCRRQINDSDDSIVRFESALIQMGYSDFYQDEYAKLNFRVLEDLLFKVDRDFPKLTTTNFPHGLPNGIEKIEYEINLNSFDNLITARNPDQMSL